MEYLTALLADLKDPVKRAAKLKSNRLNMILYCSACIVVLFVYHFLSDGDFSFLLTVGGLIRLFGFSMLLFKCVSSQSGSGLSLKTLELYVGVFVFRLCSILFYEGYLPYDKSGDWLYQTVEAASLLVVCATAFLVAVKFKSTYNPDEDPFGKNMQIPPEFGAVYLAVPCLVLAMIVHPTLNQNFFTDTAWTFALYLETVAVIPQLYMFQKSNKEVEEWTAHFVFTLGLSRVMLFTFWLSSYHELSDAGGKSITGGWVGMFVLLNQIIHLLVMGDFCYYYVKSLRSGSPLVLPGLQV